MELLLAERVNAENPIEGDLLLRAGDLVWSSVLAEEVAQRLRTRFRFFRGEWFIDARTGTPWFQNILGQKPTNSLIRAIFSTLILTTEGVASLIRLDPTLDRGTRLLSLSFEARLEDGSVFRTSSFPPFVLPF